MKRVFSARAAAWNVLVFLFGALVIPGALGAPYALHAPAWVLFAFLFVLSGCLSLLLYGKPVFVYEVKFLTGKPGVSPGYTHPWRR